MSQLLLRLERDLDTATDPVAKAEIMARRACCYARLGLFDSARSQVSELRTAFGDGHSGRATVWIMLAEGLIAWYSNLSPQALDRISRALFLSVEMKYFSFVSIVSAWKAHIQFEISRFEDMFKSLELAVQHSSPDNFEANTRIAIVVFDVATICGDFRRAKNWFSAARNFALNDGDRSSVEALQTNKAIMTVAWLRAESCIRDVDADFLRATRREFESARNFMDLTDNHTLASYFHLTDARLLFLESRYDEAESRFRAVKEDENYVEHYFSKSFIDLEISHCQLKARRLAEASRSYLAVNFSSFGNLHIDDQLAAAFIRNDMTSAVVGLDPADTFEALSVVRNEYDASQYWLKSAIDHFVADKLIQWSSH